jgi:hypothetical protein
MAVNVVSFVSYLTRPPWREIDRDAIRLIRALKGRTVNGSTLMCRLAKPCTLDATNTEQALEWFAKLGALSLAMKRLPHPIVLVPIPNSDCYSGNYRTPRTLQLAEAIARHVRNVIVCDVLRWKRERRPAHLHGARDQKKLYNDLVLTSVLAKGTPVLVDDVFTTGGHVLAAAARISNAGNRCCQAICLGRTVLTQQDKAFSVMQATL